MNETLYFVLEIVGTIAFAISGAMVGIENKMDIFGVVVLGMTTAVGGGIIRDLIIGITPPVAFTSPIYALLSIAVSLIVFIPSIRNKINVNHILLIIIDALGLGVFTVIGILAALPFNSLFLEIFLGVLTGVGGGVLRDIFANVKPMIFVRHIYATACLLGTIVFEIIYPFSNNLAVISTICFIVAIRYLAAKNGWHLPKA